MERKMKYFLLNRLVLGLPPLEGEGRGEVKYGR